MADQEFRVSLDPVMKDDPISRLGFDGDTRFMMNPLAPGAYYIPQGTDPKAPLLNQISNTYEVDAKPDSVIYSREFAGSPDVISHEMRHRGLQRLYDYFNENPEGFFEKYGDEAATVLQMANQSGKVNEYLTEIGDDPDATWVDDEGNTRRLGETIQEFSESSEYAPVRKRVYQQLSKAAQDMLLANGEEPSAFSPKEPDKGFWYQLFGNKSFAKGGVVSGRNAGRNNLDRQTEEAFNPRIDPFSLPQGANPSKDERIPGELDDAGYYTYRTRAGEIYTTRPKEDQRTTRGKVEDWVGEGAPLPSMRQVAEVAKQIPQAAYQSAAGAVRGRATLGEVLGFAPGMQAASLPAKVPAGALRTGGGATAKPKENPIFRSRREIPEVEVDKEDPVHLTQHAFAGEYGLTEVPIERVGVEVAPYRFYSPIRQTVENMNFVKGTITGQAIKSELERVLNQGGGIRNSELIAADLPIDPKKRYTKEEAMQLVYDNTWEITPTYEHAFPTEQRIELADRGVSTVDFDSYTEITLEASRPKGGSFSPSGYNPDRWDTGTHYTPNTVAHVRVSQREGADGDYLLVEEMQSDLMARGTKPKQKGQTPLPEDQVEAYANNHLDKLISEMEKPFKNLTPEKRQKILEAGIMGSKVSSAKWNSLMDEIRQSMGQRGEDLALGVSTHLRELGKEIPTYKDAPFNKPEDWLRLTVLSSIAEAQRRGLDRVVIPTPEDIAALRYTYDELTNRMVPLRSDQKTGFNKIYGKSLEKVLRQLDEELGGIPVSQQTFKGIELGQKDIAKLDKLNADFEEFMEIFDLDPFEVVGMPYQEAKAAIMDASPSLTNMQAHEVLKEVQTDVMRATRIRNREADVNGRVLDISGLPKMNESEMRFAQGGLVNTLDSDSFAEYLEGGRKYG